MSPARDHRFDIRSFTEGDRAGVLAVNAANVPEVGPLDDERLDLFVDVAIRIDVVVDGSRAVGLFVGLFDGTAYGSPNYRWFAQRHEQFAYVDRIALMPPVRGAGVASELYDRFEREAVAGGRPFLCAEVNVEPPNPRSLRFHERRGFTVVAECTPYGPDERVAMMEKHL